MIRRVRLAGVILGSVCLLAWLAPDVSAQPKKGKQPPGKAKGKGPGKGKGTGKGPGTGQNTQALGLAIRDLQEARIWLADGQPIYNGHRGRAMNYVEGAINELMQANTTGGNGGAGKATVGKQGKGKGGKGKAVAKGPAKGTGTGTQVVKLKNNNNLPAGWEVSNGQLQQAAMLIQTAIGKMKGNDPHIQAASASAQLALQEINYALTFMNNLASGGNTTGTAKKGKR